MKVLVIAVALCYLGLASAAPSRFLNLVAMKAKREMSPRPPLADEPAMTDSEKTAVRKFGEAVQGLAYIGFGGPEVLTGFLDSVNGDGDNTDEMAKRAVGKNRKGPKSDREEIPKEVIDGIKKYGVYKFTMGASLVMGKMISATPEIYDCLRLGKDFCEKIDPELIEMLENEKVDDEGEGEDSSEQITTEEKSRRALRALLKGLQ